MASGLINWKRTVVHDPATEGERGRGGREREGEREIEGETDRQTDRTTDRQTDRERHTDI